MVECRETLTTGLVDLGLAEDSLKINQLLAFIELLTKWNKTYNLTAITDKEKMVGWHLLDSLAISPYIRGQRLCDVGTGAGLPGIPLAIYHPERQFVLLDSLAKKTRFVQQVIIELKLKNVTVLSHRVENFKAKKGFDTLMCRAFSSMNSIVTLTTHLLAENGLLLAMKAQLSAFELQELVTPYQLIKLSIPNLDIERHLVAIESKAISSEAHNLTNNPSKTVLKDFN